MEKTRNFVKKYLPIHAIVLFFLAIISFIIWLISTSNPTFADWITDNVGHPIRRILAAISSPFPISIAEILLFLSPLIVGLIVFFGIRRKKGVPILRYALSVISILSLFYTSYVFTLGIGYQRTSVASKMNISAVEVNESTLTETLLILKEKCEAELDKISFEKSGASVSDIGLDRICDDVVSAYTDLARDFPGLKLKNFDSSAKPVLSSKLMSKLEILGIYSYFTGESNVNTYFPDYNLPFTVAHEFAHQRGIARENEANFIAFLVCIRSESPYVRYSGYFNMFEYVASALGKTNKEALKSVYIDTDMRIIGEMRAYSEFYKANKSEFLAKLSDFVNDNYLKSQGTEGIVSYGLVVRLCVAYYCNG